jgi:hypothetical protein
MNFFRFIDKLFMILGIMTGTISAIISYSKGESYLWQLACVAWIFVAMMKQITIDNFEDDK